MLAPAAPDDVNLNEAADSKKPAAADKIIKDPKGKALRKIPQSDVPEIWTRSKGPIAIVPSDCLCCYVEALPPTCPPRCDCDLPICCAPCEPCKTSCCPEGECRCCECPGCFLCKSGGCCACNGIICVCAIKCCSPGGCCYETEKCVCGVVHCVCGFFELIVRICQLPCVIFKACLECPFKACKSCIKGLCPECCLLNGDLTCASMCTGCLTPCGLGECGPILCCVPVDRMNTGYGFTCLCCHVTCRLPCSKTKEALQMPSPPETRGRFTTNLGTDVVGGAPPSAGIMER